MMRGTAGDCLKGGRSPAGRKSCGFAGGSEGIVAAGSRGVRFSSYTGVSCSGAVPGAV